MSLKSYFMIASAALLVIAFGLEAAVIGLRKESDGVGKFIPRDPALLRGELSGDIIVRQTFPTSQVLCRNDRKGLDGRCKNYVEAMRMTVVTLLVSFSLKPLLLGAEFVYGMMSRTTENTGLYLLYFFVCSVPTVCTILATENIYTTVVPSVARNLLLPDSDRGWSNGKISKLMITSTALHCLATLLMFIRFGMGLCCCGRFPFVNEPEWHIAEYGEGPRNVIVLGTPVEEDQSPHEASPAAPQEEVRTVTTITTTTFDEARKPTSNEPFDN